MEDFPFGTGASRSTEDKRDHKDEEISFAFPFPAIYESNIGIIVPENVKNQKKIGICTASLVYYIEYLYWKKYGAYVKLSIAFLYLITKRHIDNNDFEGSSLRSALKAAQKYGVCTEASFPSNTDLSYFDFMKQKLTPALMEEALLYKIGEYVSVPIEPNLIAGSIYKNGMVYARVCIDFHWWKPSWLTSDIDPLQKPVGEYTGHAVHIVGYNDTGEKTKLKVLNTWSRDWNNNGQGTIEYENYLPYLTEAWAVTLDPVSKNGPDNSPMISLETIRQLVAILKRFGTSAKSAFGFIK